MGNLYWGQQMLCAHFNPIMLNMIIKVILLKLFWTIFELHTAIEPTAIELNARLIPTVIKVIKIQLNSAGRGKYPPLFITLNGVRLEQHRGKMSAHALVLSAYYKFLLWRTI